MLVTGTIDIDEGRLVDVETLPDTRPPHVGPYQVMVVGGWTGWIVNFGNLHQWSRSLMRDMSHDRSHHHPTGKEGPMRIVESAVSLPLGSTKTRVALPAAMS